VTPFDLCRAPLQGSNLIEAAAGTGKTFSIEGLFVRLLLEQQIPVQEILVVTFTQAATAELRGRIHGRLLEMRSALTRGSTSDPLIGSLIARCQPPEPHARRINQALMDFDQAAIYTIHGFCQRVLHEHAFETASPFDAELLPDQTAMLREIADDFWRRRIGAAPIELVAAALEAFKGPDHFLRLLAKIKTPEFHLVLPEGGETLGRLRFYREALNALREGWASQREAVAAALRDSALDGRIYGSLKPIGGGRRGSERERRVDALLDAMDVFLGSPPGFPPFRGFEQLSADYISAKTRQRSRSPQHSVFDLCQRVADEAEGLGAEMRLHLKRLKVSLVQFARSELTRRKQSRNLQSFDDLLTLLLRSLTGPDCRVLVESVRRRFQAALVDEFQDTDELQYAIFSRLFAEAQNPVFLIGDPKQAIYGFRGADIYSYLRASQRCGSRFTLGVNRRSTPGVVGAINSIFARVPAPFLIPDIQFAPALSAREMTAEAEPAFVIWYLDSRRMRPDGKPANRGDAEPWIARSVAAEIRRLTQGRPEPMPAGEIAVLVRTNRQARQIKKELAAAGVPAVVCSAGDVFDSAEAAELQRILSGIAAPSDLMRIKSALATDILGAAADELLASELNSAAWEARFARFREYSQTWQADGFMPMFRRLLVQERVKERLLRRPDGERRLTNLLHLAELIHQAAAERHLGLNGLIKWLSSQRDPSIARVAEHPLRLESDADAVNIVTIHKSKGLEYRVVFCPFAWSASKLAENDYFFHDPASGHRLTLEIGAETGSASRSQAEVELLSENLRLLYVAFTRARDRCYFNWGRIHRTETSAPAYLLHYAAEAQHPAGAADPQVVRRLEAVMKAKTDEDLVRDLETIAAGSGGTIALRPLPEPPALRPAAPQMPEQTLFCRSFRGAIDRSWKTASYSMLVSAAAAHAETPDRDETRYGLPPLPEAPDISRTAALPGRDLMAFPRGSRAGNFFHSVLEKADFGNPDSPEMENWIVSQLAEFGYAPEWCNVVQAMLAAVASVPLAPDQRGWTLADVPPTQRLHEMEFYFALNRITPEVLADVWARFGRRTAGGAKADSVVIGGLDFAPLQGFMKGFIDVVFHHAGRYYLLDWKSNYLGDRLQDYHRQRLDECMREELYILQYHIYALALHQYLRRRVPDYQYERDFGGAAYVFIRGVGRTAAPDHGIFFDKPLPELIHALGGELIPNYA
jgi:exodeoxyribonuclease V beta subunit